MSDTMRYTVIGDDRLSSPLDRAGRSAARLDRRLDEVGTHGGASITALTRDADGRLRGMDGRFAAVGERAERGMGDGVERGSRRARSGLGGLLPILGRLGSMGGSLLSAVAPVAKLAAVAGGGIPLVAGLVATVEQLAPAAGVAATGVLAVVSATAALKIGMIGVGDAVKAAFDPKTKPKQLQAALDKLAPSARRFVLTLKDMQPAFTRLQIGVQGALFAGLSARVRDLGASLLPVLRRQLTQTAGTLNIMGKGVADTAGSLADSGILGRALAGANRGLRNLAGIPAQLVNGLGLVAAAAAPSFARLTAGAAKAVGKISDKLNAAFDSGAMQQAIETAISLFGQLGHVLGNIGTIVGNVFSQVGAAGGGLVGMLGTVTGALAKASAMPGVQKAFSDLFEVMGEIGKVAGPLLTSAFAILGPVITTLAPPLLRLIDSLGAGLQPIITALGPVLLAAAVAVGQLLDAASPLLPVVGQMIAALGPVLTPVLQVVGDLFSAVAPVLAQLGKSLLPPVAAFTKTLASAFHLLAPVLQTALSQLGTQGLTPIIKGLGVVLGQIITQYSAQFLQMFQQLLPVIPQLTPVLIQVGKSLGQILTAVAPLVPQLALMGVQLLTAVLPAVLPLIPPLAQLTVLLLRLATGVITKVVVPVIGALVRVMGGLKTALQPAIDAVKWVTTSIAGAFRWLYDLLIGHSIIPDLVNGIVGWFAGLPGRAATALAGLAGKIGGKARDAANRMILETITGLNATLSWLGDLPGRAVDKLGDLSTTLYKSGQKLIGGFIDGIASMGKSVAGAVGSILGKAKGFFPNSPAKEGPFSGRGYPLYSGQTIMRDFTAGIVSGKSGLVSAVAGVTSAAAGALPDSMAVGAGVPPVSRSAGRNGPPVQVTFEINGALDPVAVGREVRRVLLELKRTYGVNIDLGLGGT